MMPIRVVFGPLGRVVDAPIGRVEKFVCGFGPSSAGLRMWRQSRDVLSAALEVRFADGRYEARAG